ncbi:hypothetical protein CHAB381_1460 [Campylobacter hominis ATCC BAA-381]|uniref:Uncharacterized protein n=1 Tax=Campylobacter hominis (strain ATCC BAA-381 / DSM 21671 / CCUG 45161 / LMG 19568 / NCTC 13146 / CH001A) TaxID=360107 RepID=A7I3A5_CAMHC|nr:hypothetical protein CHAB381_1460 [Campylobacter hominis ATCC BAA-381]
MFLKISVQILKSLSTALNFFSSDLIFKKLCGYFCIKKNFFKGLKKIMGKFYLNVNM